MGHEAGEIGVQAQALDGRNGVRVTFDQAAVQWLVVFLGAALLCEKMN